MVYSGSNLMENPQSYGAAKVKGMGFFKTGAISGRFATFFWVRCDDIIHTPPVYSITCQSLRTYEQPKGRIPPKAVLFLCSY